MFLDGVTYSAISNNLAHGLGSVFKPHYTQTLYPEFYEHPPLFFIIQSSFFKIFGSGIFTERIFTFLSALSSALGIILIWNLFPGESKLRKHSWIAVLLWITVPIITWSFKNNMIENLLSVLTLFSVYFLLKSLLKRNIGSLLIGSILILFSFLVKGPVGLFPLIVPLIFALSFYDKKQLKSSLLYQIYLIGFSLSLFLILMRVFPELKYNLEAYLEQQLLPALSNSRELTTDNRFSILLRLLTEIAFPLIVFLIVAIRSKIYSNKEEEKYHQVSLLFLLIALSGSLPLLLSLKQAAFYLVPSIPFYILSITFYMIPKLQRPLEKISDRLKTWIMYFSAFATLLVIIYSMIHINDYSRDQSIIEDVKSITENIPPYTILACQNDLMEDWTAIAYFSRIGFISLDKNPSKHSYYIHDKNSSSSKPDLEKYDPILMNLNRFEVYKRKE